MRRRDREITNLEEIGAIMGECLNATIAFGGDGPYAVPMSFGFEEKDGRFTLYLHGAQEGEKWTRARQDSRAAFAMFRTMGAITGDTACAHSVAYESVCGSGTLHELAGEDRLRGLAVLMEHVAPGRALPIDPRAAEATAVWRLDVEHISGKRRERK